MKPRPFFAFCAIVLGTTTAIAILAAEMAWTVTSPAWSLLVPIAMWAPAFASLVARRAEGLAFVRDETLLVLERAHVLVDFGEVLGQLRFPGAQILPGGAHDRAGQPEASGDLERETSAWRSVDQLIGRRERFGIEPERRARHAVGR